MVINTFNSQTSIRTTVTLPKLLVERSLYFINKGVVPNRNALIVAAVEQFLRELEREEIDKQFAVMANDEAYQALNIEIAESFSESDWEALELAERGIT